MIFTLALHKFIIKLLYWTLIACIIFVLIRIAVALVSIQAALPALAGGIFGFFVVGVVCAGYIRHMLIRFYLQQAIDKNKQAAKAGRLWWLYDKS